jgi:hypothetical protein
MHLAEKHQHDSKLTYSRRRTDLDAVTGGEAQIARLLR